MRKQVYCCRFTKKLFRFEDKAKYIKHLKKLRGEFKEKRETKRKLAHINSLEKHIREDLTSIKEIEDFLNQHLWELYIPNEWDGKTHSKEYIDNIRISLNVSLTTNRNTHSSPVGTPTKWSSPDTLPAWYGRVAINNNPSFCRISDMLKLVKIHTGSGGSHYGFDVTLWDADFEGLRKGRALDIIAGKRVYGSK